MMQPHVFWNQKPLEVAPLAPASLSLLQEDHGFQPEPLSSALEWHVFQLDDTEAVAEWQRFLAENYKTNGFPFQIVYSRAHLAFELASPLGHWILALRSTKHPSRPIVACIAGAVRHIHHTFPGIQPDALSNVLFIEFLCVHPSLRHLRLAPKLIHEISRLAHTSPACIQKAYYNSATRLPGAFCCSDNYHRPIQWERCFDTGYVPASFRASSHCQDWMAHDAFTAFSREFQFRKWADVVVVGNTIAVAACALINDYNRRHRKLYEPMTVELWDKMCHCDCVDIVLVYHQERLVGCLTTISHPYACNATQKTLNTILLYTFGFDLRLTSDQTTRIWNALFPYAYRHLPHWDAFTTIHPEVSRAIGFRKGHAYYHYMYNVQMMPLESSDISMIGI